MYKQQKIRPGFFFSSADLQNLYGVELMKQGHMKGAILKWKIAAKMGSLHALYNLGAYCCFWKRPWNDFEKGANFWKIAARRGHCRSMYQLGCLHVHAILAHSNVNYGLELIEKSASGGYMEACFYLAMRMLHDQHYEQAEAYLKNVLHKKIYKKEIKEWVATGNVPAMGRELVKKLLQDS